MTKILMLLLAVGFLAGCSAIQEIPYQELNGEFLGTNDSDLGNSLNKINQKKPTENYCTDKDTGNTMTLTRAMALAQNSVCTQDGTLDVLEGCNKATGTWWIKLNLDKKGCTPACVVDVNTSQVEINWRCTGEMSMPEIERRTLPMPN